MREESTFRRNAAFIIVVIVSVLVVLFCAKETVMSQGRLDVKGKKSYYAAMEAEYRADMEKVLEEEGYAGSGITVRWVSDSEGARTYTVMIHHRRIDYLDEDEKENLVHKLVKTEFNDEECSFQYEFITL